MRKILFVNGEPIRDFFAIDTDLGIALIEGYFINNGVLMDTPKAIASFYNDRYCYNHLMSHRDIREFAELSPKLKVTKLDKDKKINNERYKIELV